MARAVLESVALFLTPFVVYALYLIMRRRAPHQAGHWPGWVITTLTAAGLVLAIAFVVAIGATAPREQGAYRPAHIENGRLTPGRFE